MSGIHPTFYKVLRGFIQSLQATAERADPRQNRPWRSLARAFSSLFNYHIVIHRQMS